MYFSMFFVLALFLRCSIDSRNSADVTCLHACPLAFIAIDRIVPQFRVQMTQLNAGASIGFFRGDPTLLVEDMQVFSVPGVPYLATVDDLGRGDEFVRAKQHQQ